MPNRYAGYPVKVQLTVDRISIYFNGKKSGGSYTTLQQQ
ncbi:hypothetical protein [Desulfosediminicola flagellatus]